MKNKSQRVEIDISWAVLFKILGLAIGLWVIVVLRDIWFMLLGVFLFVAVVNPIIRRWQRHMSRPLALTFFYTLLFALAVIVLSVFTPTLIAQVKDIAKTLPDLLSRVQPYLKAQFPSSYVRISDQLVSTLQNGLQGFSNNLVATTVDIAGILALVATGIVVSFYLLLEEDNARIFLHQVLPSTRFKAVYKTADKIANRMGSWVRGQLSLMLIIGISDLVGYLILRVPAPLPLALWAGLCEAIPFVGPTLGLIPAVIVALATGNVGQAILVVIVGYFVIQQLEANVLVPRLMSKAVGLSPVLVILALLIGAQLFGGIGAIVAVPVAAAISVVVEEWPQLRTIWETPEKELE